jgi:hypothetical protein
MQARGAQAAAPLAEAARALVGLGVELAVAEDAALVLAEKQGLATIGPNRI